MTIRRRLVLLFLLFSILPLLAYRLAIDLQHLILTHQASLHQQTVQNLSLILENRPELWGQTRETGQVLSHIDLTQSSIWLVNESGQTQYVMGHLNSELAPKRDIFETLGYRGLQLVSHITNPLPYPFPQSEHPERAIIQAALLGKSRQQYRINQQQEPVSLMSASPLYQHNQIVGVVIFEQGLEQLFRQSLRGFHRLIGLSTVILLLVLAGILFYARTLSNRILLLADDVQHCFSVSQQLQLGPINRQEGYQDELTQLRFTISEMLEKLASYERYLKQLPKTLRHELHNPINRVSANLELLALAYPEQPKIQYAQQGLNQLQALLTALSDANSLEQSLQTHSLHPLRLHRIIAYFESIQQSSPPGLVEIDIDNGLGQDQILAEGFLLEQLIDKLVDNAFDFNDNKQPVRLSLKRAKNQALISVSNSGCLIPQGMENQIFEGMVSIRQPDSSNGSHLGLGLYLAKLIANHHHGQLSANNWPNQTGVIFSLKLDLIDAVT
jgi:signal transduction histidine kinase